MARKIPAWLLILLIAAGLASFLSYRAQRAKIPLIRVEKDQSDITSFMGSAAQASYDPYFARVNIFSPRIVASGKNQLSGISGSR
jgi:hypothetical protein